MVTPQPGDWISVAYYDDHELVRAYGIVVSFDDGLLTVDSTASPAALRSNSWRERTFNVRSLGFLWFEEGEVPLRSRTHQIVPRSIAGDPGI